MQNIGEARLRVARRDTKSVVTQQFGKAPLQVHAPLYLGDSLYPTVYLRSPSAGLLDGDAHLLSLDIEAGAELEVRTQAATLVYPGKSKQVVTIKIAAGASLTFLPDPLILAAGAQFNQQVHIELEEDARLHYCDHWCAGRVAMGEKFQFASFSNTIEIWRQGKLAFREHWLLQPGNHDYAHPLLCGRYTHFKSLYEFEGSELEQTQDKQPSDTGIFQKQWQLQRDNAKITRTAYGFRGQDK